MAFPNGSIPVIIVMPVYNEASCIERVLLKWIDIASRFFGLLMIVDDGSTDETPEILKRMSEMTSVIRVIHQKNQGHGSAVLQGYREALKLNPHYIFQIDSDDELDPQDFEKLWFYRHESPFILGNRENRQDGLLRIILSRLHAVLLLLLFNVELHDANIPFRLMETEFLKLLMRYLPESVHWIPNILLSILAAKSKATVIEISVQHRKRASGVSSLNKRLWHFCKSAFKELYEFKQHFSLIKNELILESQKYLKTAEAFRSQAS